MPRSFDMAAEYEGSVEQVHQAFSDQTYWLERLADSGADRATLDSMKVGGDGGIDVVTTQVLRRDRLPGMVTQFHPGDLSIVREEKWSPVSDGKATAAVTGAIPGAPVSLSGTAQLGPAGTAARGCSSTPPSKCGSRSSAARSRTSSAANSSSC